MEPRFGWQIIRNQVALQPEAKFYGCAAKFDRLELIGYRMQRSTGFFVRLPPFKSFKRFKTFETEWSD
jgi:hypothetical protein